MEEFEENEPIPYLTYAIIAINILVFIWMTLDGADFWAHDPSGHIRWGSNFAPLTLSGDWWRLLSNTFIHFGPIHLAMNMYALWSIGILLEPLLGRTKYLIAYLCCGLLASLVSLWWHAPVLNSAGASGAIFGLYGLFLALLTTRLFPDEIKSSLLTYIALFIGYNIFEGFKDGIDNAAHLGGFLSGLLIGYFYWPFVIRKVSPFIQALAIFVFVTVTASAAASYLTSHQINDQGRSQILAELSEARFSDYRKFHDHSQRVLEAHDKATAALDGFGLTVAELAKNVEEVAIPSWKQADQLLSEMELMEVSDKAKKRAGLMRKYIRTMIRQLKLIQDPVLGDSARERLMRKHEMAIDKLTKEIEAL